MSDLFSVLDGAPHTGTIRSLPSHAREWVEHGVTYCDTGHLHDHEQHDAVRWFRRVDLSPVEVQHP